VTACRASARSRGTFVADDAPTQAPLERIAAEAAAAARDAGIAVRDLARAIYLAAPSGDAPSPATAFPDTAVADTPQARRELRRQIARLEARVLPDPAPAEPGAVPHLAGLEELERTRDRMLDRLRIAGREAERLGEREAVARRRIDAMARDPERHKWEWVSAGESGDPGCKTYSVSPQWGPVGAAMGWWRIKVSGGCPLPGPA
jgi:hypothetical protein